MYETLLPLLTGVDNYVTLAYKKTSQFTVIIPGSMQRRRASITLTAYHLRFMSHIVQHYCTSIQLN